MPVIANPLLPQQYAETLLPAAPSGASTPFVLHLSDEPYILTQHDLETQADERVRRSRKWFCPTVRLLSFTRNNVCIALKCGALTYTMTVVVEPDKLHLSCSCNEPVRTMCLHVYRGLRNIIGYSHTRYFEQFRPLGIAELALRYPQYFKKEKTFPAANDQYVPKDSLGTVYRLSPQGQPGVYPATISFPARVPMPVPDTAVCFIVLTSYRHLRMPCIVPAAGWLNTAGNGLKQFLPFLSNAGNLLTDDQKRLSATGLEMWKLAEQLPGSFVKIIDEHKLALEHLFRLWEEVLPMLCRQSLVYGYRLSRLNDLKRKPVKNRMLRYRMQPDRPVLQFVLKDQGAYYTFYPELVVKGERLQHFSKEDPLLVMAQNNVYLLASLKDAMLVALLEKMTVFKEHYPEFEKDMIIPLRKDYRIVMK